MTGFSSIFQDAVLCCSDDALILIGQQSVATAYSHVLEQVKNAASQPIQDLSPYWQLACKAKQIFDEHMRCRFEQVADQMPHYGVSRFDINSLMARLILIGAKSIRWRQRTGRWIAILCATSEISATRYIGGVFPQSRFVFLDEVDAGFRDSLGDRSLSLALGDDSEGWQVNELKSRLDAFWPVHCDQGDGNRDQHDSAQVLTKFCFPDEKPIFVVGAGRSGTSAVQGALTQAVMLKGWNEGHLFPLAAILAGELKARAEELGLNTGEADQVWRAPFLEIQSLYKNHFCDEVWVDKTPDSEMIRCIPILHSIYPQGRFIYMHRHPVSCVLSRQRKFGESFELACHAWAHSVRAWDETKRGLHCGSYVELSQTELTIDSRAAAQKIGNLLQLNQADLEATTEYFSSSRPEFLGGAFSADLFDGTDGNERRIGRRQAIYGWLRDSEEIELDNVPWTSEQKQYFVATCGELALQIGYMRRPSVEERHSRVARIATRIEELENERQTEFAKVIENCAKSISYQTTEARMLQQRIISAKRIGMICGAAGMAVALLWCVGQSYFSSSPAWLLSIMHVIFLGSLAFPALPAYGIGRLAALAFLILQNGVLYGSVGVVLPWGLRRFFSKAAPESVWRRPASKLSKD